MFIVLPLNMYTYTDILEVAGTAGYAGAYPAYPVDPEQKRFQSSACVPFYSSKPATYERHASKDYTIATNWHVY
jgi:hypothetical protein